MANVSVPRGLVPYRHYDGSLWNGSANIYFIPAGNATNIFIGDPVVMLNTANDANGIPGVSIATAGAGNPVLGSIVGIVAGGTPQIAITRDLPIYRQASVAQYVLVADDPLLTYWIQDDGSATVNANFPGKNANLVSGAGSTVTGYSGWQLNATGVATGNATFQLRILRLLDSPADSLSNTQPPIANSKWLVKLNQHQLANGTAA